MKREDSKTGKGFIETLKTFLSAANPLATDEEKITNDPLLLKQNYNNEQGKKLKNFDKESEISEFRPRHEESIIVELNEGLSKIAGGFNNGLTIEEFKNIRENPSQIKSSPLLPEARNYNNPFTSPILLKEDVSSSVVSPQRKQKDFVFSPKKIKVTKSAPGSPREKKSDPLSEGVSQSTPNSPREHKKTATSTSKTQTTQSAPGSPGLDTKIHITKEQKESSKIVGSPKGSFIYNTREKLEEAASVLKNKAKHKEKKEPKDITDKEAELKQVKDKLKVEKPKIEHKHKKSPSVIENKEAKSLKNKQYKSEKKQTNSPLIIETKEAESLKKNKEGSKKSKSEIRSYNKDKKLDAIENKKLNDLKESPSEIRPKIGEYSREKNFIPFINTYKAKEGNIPKPYSEEDERQPTMDFESLEKAEAAVMGKLNPGTCHTTLFREDSDIGREGSDINKFFRNLGDSIMEDRESAEDAETAVPQAIIIQPTEAKEHKEEIIYEDQKNSDYIAKVEGNLLTTDQNDKSITEDIASSQLIKIKEPKQEITYGEEGEFNHLELTKVKEDGDTIKYEEASKLNYFIAGSVIVRPLIEKAQKSTNELIENVSPPMVNARDYMNTSNKEAESQAAKIEEHKENMTHLDKYKDSAIQPGEKKVSDKDISHNNNDNQFLEDARSSLKQNPLVPKEVKKEYNLITDNINEIEWKKNFDKIFILTKSQIIRLQKIKLKETNSDAAKEIAKLKETEITESRDVESTSIGRVTETTVEE